MTTSETEKTSANGKDADREVVREELDLWISGSEEPEEVELWDISPTDEGAQEMQEEELAPV